MVDLNALSSGRIEQSLVPVLVEGLDLTRTVPAKALGVFTANPTVTILAGQVVTRNSNGFIIPCTGLGPVGIAKWNKTNVMFGTAQFEPLVLSGVAPSSLNHPLVAAVLVTNPATQAVFTAGVDYSVNAPSGTIARIVTGAIVDGSTVLVSYRYQALSSDIAFNGGNFFNNLDDTAQAQGRMTVIQGLSTIFSAAYDTSRQYHVNDTLYCGADSYISNNNAGGAVVGIAIQVPTVDDPYLGFDLTLLA